MLKSIDADKHNFGQSVKPMERASGVWYRKPRPIFWEYFFFGKKSPLAGFFIDRGENGAIALGSSLFNLDVEIEAEWLGYAKEIAKSDVAASPQHFYSFGILLAYAYTFGIRDLHKNNLVMTATHLQAVDAEIVLTDLILPNETVLLPFKDIAYDRCGANALAPSMADFTAEDRKQILAGYFDLFAVILRNRAKIQSAFDGVPISAPIRVIVRNTRAYKQHFDGTAPIVSLLREEQIQLERGDVPYFFKRCGDTNLYWLSSVDGAESVVSDLAEFKPDINRHAQFPAKLIGSADVIERKMAQGAFLLQKSLSDSIDHEFAWNEKRLTLSSSGLENHFTGHVFRKKT